jgi:hypothetical protein
MFNKILNDLRTYEAIIIDLKKKSNYYPQLTIEEHHHDYDPVYNKVLFASALVRMEWNGTWYVVHLVERILMTEGISEKDVIMMMMESAHKLQYLYKVTGNFEDVDSIQTSEKDRLLKIEKERFKKLKP